jgi:uncharacterized RDD family membrane protein YckC
LQPPRSPSPSGARRTQAPPLGDGLLEPSLGDASFADQGTVLALDNVQIDLPLARVGSRVLAGLVDYLLVLVLILLWSLAAFLLARSLGLQAGWGVAGWLLGLFAIDYGTFAAQELLFEGRTLGKRLFQLRVVARDGAAASSGAILVRNLVRTIDVMIGVPLMALDPLSRRLGDRLAGTLVVHERAAAELLLARLPAGWGAAEARVVESFLRRAEELEPEAQVQLGRRVEAWVDGRAPGFLPGAPGRDPLPRLRAGFGAAPVTASDEPVS